MMKKYENFTFYTISTFFLLITDLITLKIDAKIKIPPSTATMEEPAGKS